MEDLQSTLQSILSDPEQMSRIAAMAESLGLKTPDGPPPSQGADAEQPRSGPEPPRAGPELDLGRLMGQLTAMSGTEDRVLGALRPTLSPAGQGRVDRALRAAKLSRLAGRFLARQKDAHV